MIRHRSGQSGFTLVEVLLSLAIAAILMVALGTAFNAAMMNYTSNQALFEATSSAREALLRITGQLRTANYVDATTPATQCDLFDPNNDYYLFEYQPAGQKLVLSRGGTEYDLCENVTAMAFTKQPSAGDPNSAMAVRITMTVSGGDVSQNLATAVLVRRVAGN